MNADLRTIRAQLARYLAGVLSLAEFRDWFAPASWDVDETSDAETQIAVHEIEHRIAEFTSGVWTESDLREHLMALIPDKVSDTANETAALFFSSNQQTGSSLSSANQMATSERTSFVLGASFSVAPIPA